MSYRALLAAACLCFAYLPPLFARTASDSPLQYKWVTGQMIRYLILRDPYFADPQKCIETADPNAPYRSPIVSRLTEKVLSVDSDGTATLQVTISPEPGFEDDSHPQPPITQTVTVNRSGEMTDGSAASHSTEMLAAIFRLPTDPPPVRNGVSVITQAGPPTVQKATSPSHDGILLQTTQSRRQDRVVFDTYAGNVLRRTETITGSLSLVMIRPKQRSGADFGRVVPSLPILQTLTLERK